MNGDTYYFRNPAIAETEIDSETFLVEPNGGEVFYLDEISSALWRFLSEKRRYGEISEIFSAAFPDIAPVTIDGDIQAALDDLVTRELVVVSSE
jgi:hypothetical protein